MLSHCAVTGKVKRQETGCSCIRKSKAKNIAVLDCINWIFNIGDH